MLNIKVDESNKNNFVTNVDKMLDDGLTFLASCKIDFKNN